jgi:hypothetical protein
MRYSLAKALSGTRTSSSAGEDALNEMITSCVLVCGQDPDVESALGSKRLSDRHGGSSAFYFHNAVRASEYRAPFSKVP